MPGCSPAVDAYLGGRDYPLVARPRSLLPENHTQAEFERALEALLGRMDLAVSQ